MAVQVEIWARYIMENLFETNEFLQHSFSADEYVTQGSLVHIPQAGSPPSVEKNRNVFPAVAVRRSDGDVIYPLDVYTTDPSHIPNAELMEISYDKIGSVLSDHMGALRETTGSEMIYKWSPTLAGSIVRTSGAAVSAHLAGATGNRKKFVKEDLKRARTLLDKQAGIPKTDRYALIDADMFDQLMDDADLIKRDSAMDVDLKNGIISRLYGFNILVRSASGIYDNAGTPAPKAPGAAAGTADNAGIICWQKNAVERALGTVKFFENLNDPQYYGDVYSALVKFGGRVRREDGKGIVAIVQDPAA